MNCEAWHGKLDAYADAELPPETMRSLAEHLSGCLACTAEMVQIMQLKRVTGSAGKRYAAAPEFRARIRRDIAAKPARGGWQWALGLALAAVVVVGLGLAILLPSRTAARSRLIAGVVDSHVTALASASPVDVVSSDRHTVKPWFAGRLPFTFNLPELTGSPFALAGGRMVYLDNRPGAQLIYDVRKHRLSVFILQEGGDFSRLLPKTAEPWRALSFNGTTWSAGGLRYFVVSDAAPEDVKALWEMMRRVQ